MNINLTDPVITDLARIVRAEKEGRPRPTVSASEAPALLDAYEQAAQGAPDAATAAFYWERIQEIRDNEAVAA